MQLTTIRYEGRTMAGRVEGDEIVLLDHADVGAILRSGADTSRGGRTVALADADFAPLVTHPDKIVCVCVNYADHIAEMGREAPTAPTYFAKYRRALIGARDDIVLPDSSVSTNIDWEAELAIVIGAEVRNASPEQALEAIAGYTVLNDVSARDWQRRTSQFLAGKTFEAMTPLGPVMTTRDELGDGSGLEIRTEVDGVVKQQSNTSQLVFGAVDIVVDLSKILTLDPGDIIATGTPGGVGAARTPPEWLADGRVVSCSIEAIGQTTNRCQTRP